MHSMAGDPVPTRILGRTGEKVSVTGELYTLFRTMEV